MEDQINTLDTLPKRLLLQIWLKNLT